MSAVSTQAPTNAPKPSCPELVHRLSTAIAQMENVRLALNNPGGLVFVGDKPHRFKSEAAGWSALQRSVRKYIERRVTLRQMLRSWATGDPEYYAVWVGRRLHIPLNRPLLEFCHAY